MTADQIAESLPSALRENFTTLKGRSFFIISLRELIIDTGFVPSTLRFLTDFYNGDTYFRTHFAEHNLVRAKNQLKLCQDIYAKLDQMKEIVKKYA